MEYFKPEELLDNPPPTFRAAYSDRTAWLMASLSKLAYLDFETSTQKQVELESELKREFPRLGPKLYNYIKDYKFYER